MGCNCGGSGVQAGSEQKQAPLLVPVPRPDRDVGFYAPSGIRLTAGKRG